MDTLIENDVDIIDMEEDNDEIVIYGNPQDSYQIKEAITKKLPDVEFNMDEITYIPKEKITLEGENKELFERTLRMLDEVEDVQNVYHNVEL